MPAATITSRTISLAELLLEIRTRKLAFAVSGTRLLCSPSSLLTDRLREALRHNKRSLLPVLRTWGPRTGLHVLHLLYEAVPGEPFRLDRARFVQDPVVFLKRLYQDVEAGPAGPRARTGALQEDLRLLYELKGR